MSLSHVTTGQELTATIWNQLVDAINGAAPVPATSLPGSPTDGQAAILVDSTSAPTWVWNLSYSATASKWLWIGGTPAYSAVETSQTLASTGSFIDLATVGPSFTIPRAGDYSIHYGFGNADQTNPATAQWNIGGTLVGTGLQGVQNSTGSNQHGGVSRVERFTGLAASATAKLQYKGGSTAIYFENRWATLTPIAVT